MFFMSWARRCESLIKKYQSKRAVFVDMIQRWKERGYESDAARAQQQLNRIDQLLASVQANTADTTAVYKELKKLYTELNESSKSFIRQWIEAILVAGSLAVFFRNFIFGLYHVPTGSAERTVLVGDRIWGNKFAYRFGGEVKRGDTIIFDNPEFVYDSQNSFNRFWQKYVGFGIPALGLGDGPDNWTKRVIGLPGDTIEGRIENGKTAIYLNGQKLDETEYVNPYPLIALKKTTGFLPQGFFTSRGLPGLFEQSEKIVLYTYDPNKAFRDQPFYYMEPQEIFLHPQTGEPILKKAYEPDDVDVFGPMTIPANKYWVMGDNRRHSRDSRVWLFLDRSLIHGRASFVVYSVDSEESWWVFELLKHPFTFWKNHLRWNRFGKNLSTLPGKA
jgi:signal peptidase I